MIEVVSFEDFRPGVTSMAKAAPLLHIVLMILLGHVELSFWPTQPAWRWAFSTIINVRLRILSQP